MRLGAPKFTIFLGLVTPALVTSPVLQAASAGPASGRSPASIARAAPAASVSPADVLRANAKNHDDPADYAWDPAAVVSIALPPTDGRTRDGFAVSGGVVTIGSAGTYRIAGDLPDGQIVVNTEDPGVVRLILDNANVSCANSAPIVITKTAKAVIVIADGSRNSLSDGPPPQGTPNDQNRPSGAIFSRENLTITGTGALTVKGTVADGVVSRDGLIIDSGSLTVDAVDDGIRGKDYLVIKGGTASVTARGDGLRSDNAENATKGYVWVDGGQTSVTAADDGVAAKTDIVTTGGKLSVTTTGTVGGNPTPPHGIHAGGTIAIGDGEITSHAVGDGFNADRFLSISGGSITVAAGDDGLHADIGIDISGGLLKVTDSYEAAEAVEVRLRGGQVYVISRNDGLNADVGKTKAVAASRRPLVSITGGTLRVRAGDDGIDSNGGVAFGGGETVLDAAFDGIDSDDGLDVSGGTLVVNGAEDNENYQNGLDIKGPINLRGGTVLSGAASAIAYRPPADTPQGWISVWFDDPVAAGTPIHLVAGDRVVVSYLPRKTVHSLFFSSPRVLGGRSYDVYFGGEPLGDTVGGMYRSGDLTNAVKKRTVSANQ